MPLYSVQTESLMTCVAKPDLFYGTQNDFLTAQKTGLLKLGKDVTSQVYKLIRIDDRNDDTVR